MLNGLANVESPWCKDNVVYYRGGPVEKYSQGKETAFVSKRQRAQKWLRISILPKPSLRFQQLINLESVCIFVHPWEGEKHEPWFALLNFTVAGGYAGFFAGGNWMRRPSCCRRPRVRPLLYGLSRMERG